MSTSHEALLVLCTAPNAEVAADLGRRLVENKLAACVNVIGGLRSFYFWDGAVQDDSEVQMFIKTRRARFDALRTWLAAEHPYDEPEVLAFEVADGSASYLDWLVAQTS
jgi:periplasmic divalent cation tolerance protein